MQSVQLRSQELDYRSREAYGTLRSNLEFSGDDVQVVCVTSCTPNEGKSSVSFELAKSSANNGKKVLLIDADLRKSVMKSRKKGSSAVKLGLTHLLIGNNTLDEVTCETDIENFYMVFAGPVPPNPSELLGNKYFTNMIAEARELYDMVIIDNAPLGSVIDAAIVSKQCDGAMIVIEAGAISRRFVKRVIEQLQTANCRILGCILNKVNLSGNNKYYGKYYGRYYGKYYGKYYGNYGEETVEEAVERAAANSAKSVKASKTSNSRRESWDDVMNELEGSAK